MHCSGVEQAFVQTHSIQQVCTCMHPEVRRTWGLASVLAAWTEAGLLGKNHNKNTVLLSISSVSCFPLCISTFHCSPTPSGDEKSLQFTQRGSDDFQTLVLKLGRNDLRAELSCNGLPAACAGVCGSFFAEGSTGFSQKSSHILITPFTHPSTRYPSQPSRQVSF